MVLSNFRATISIVYFSICETQETGDVGNESIKEGPAAEGAKTKSLSNGVEDINIEGGVATHTESGDVDILALDSKLVEQDDKMNEGKPGIVLSQGIQIEEGLNLLDKQEGIEIIWNSNSDISPGFSFLILSFPSYVFISPSQTFHSFCRYLCKIGRI